MLLRICCTVQRCFEKKKFEMFFYHTVQSRNTTQLNCQLPGRKSPGLFFRETLNDASDKVHAL
jgi:hypothetical protein